MFILVLIGSVSVCSFSHLSSTFIPSISHTIAAAPHLVDWSLENFYSSGFNLLVFLPFQSTIYVFGAVGTNSTQPLGVFGNFVALHIKNKSQNCHCATVPLLL